MPQLSQELAITPVPEWLDMGRARELRQRMVGSSEADDYRHQQRRVRGALERVDGQVAIIFKPVGIDYLSGYASVSPGKAALALTRDGTRLRVAESEVGRALVAPGATGLDVYGWDGSIDLRAWFGALMAQESVHRFGLELSEPSTPPLAADVLRSLGAEIIDTTGLIDDIRLRVTVREAEMMRCAAEVTAKGLTAAIECTNRDDVRDNDLAAAIMATMMRESDSIARGNITVGIDELGGIPHSPWEGRRLEAGSVAFLEFSGACRRYSAPVMRTLVRGEPSPEVRELSSIVDEMRDIVLQRMRPGVMCSDIAEAAAQPLAGRRDILFHYNFGYPVGLTDHATWMNGAKFFITRDNDLPLEEDMVFHVPIVLRRFGRMAVGHSHTVRVTAEGIEVITDCVTPSGLISV
jgi:Xaa-Pro dipeptidase